MAEVMIPGFRCNRCGHTWAPRNKEEKPETCPKCTNPYWNKPRLE